MRLIRRLAFAFGGVIILLLAAAWYDEAPDAEMLRQWEGRPRVADQDNFFLAAVGALGVADAPLHETGRAVLESPSASAGATLRVPEAHRRFIDTVRASCWATSADSGDLCSRMRLPDREVQPTERSMVERYLALRRYGAYRSEMRPDVFVVAPSALLDLHAVFIATRLTVESGPVPQAALEELVADIRFLRWALEASDTVLGRMIIVAVLQRDYRLAAEIVGQGGAKDVEILRPVLEPLPARAMDLSGTLAFEHDQKRMLNNLVRQMLGRGEDPMQEFATYLERPSPFAGPAWQRRLQAPWMKPEMSANASLAAARAALGIAPVGRPLRVLDPVLNATNEKVQRFNTDDAAWGNWRNRLSDLDYYVRLVSLVGRMAGDESFDPARVAADWNAKLPAGTQAYRLGWDGKRSAFSFDPASDAWQERAKAAGHGVLVHVPPSLAQELETWRGFSARCRAVHCELLAEGRAPIAVKPKMKLPAETKAQYTVVGEVRAGKYVGIEYLAQENSGEWVMRQVRIRAANAN